MFEAAKTESDRRAALPQKAEDYKAELSKDFKLPQGWEITPDHPLWAKGREIAVKNGLSQEVFSELATIMVQDQIAQHEAVSQVTRERDESLGARGGERVEALNNWFKGMFGDQGGAQFSKTLFTKDIVEGFEKIKGALTSQGVTTFNTDGRQAPRADGKPDGYDSWSAVDKRTYDLSNTKAA